MMYVCPNCHLVSFGENGWRFINKHNRARLCVCCNHAVDQYKVENAPEWWIGSQRKMHAEWKAQRTGKRHAKTRILGNG